MVDIKVYPDWKWNRDDSGMHFTLQQLHHVTMSLNNQYRRTYEAH